MAWAASPESPREAADCALCGASLWADRLALGDRLGLLPGPWPMARCTACGHLQLRERPSAEALLGAYPPHYWRKLGQAGAAPSALARLKQAFRRRLWDAEVAPLRPWLAPNTRLLDVGAGAGDLVAAWRRLGLQAEGLERAPEGVALAQAAGLPVAQGGWEALPEGPWDAVSLWHVLEHLEAPVAALKALGDRLAPGGLLFVQVPNAASWQAWALGRRWQAWDAPRHLHHFHPESLGRCLRLAGFEPLALHQPSHRSSRSALVASLAPALDPTAIAAGGHGPLTQAAWEGALLAAVAVAAPWAWLEASFGHGATLTAVARKA